MTIKHLSFGMALALFSSFLTVMGMNYFTAASHVGSTEQAAINPVDEPRADTPPGVWQKMSTFFSSESQGKPVQFVEVKNIVVTLRGEDNRERYMLLELALTAVDNESAQLTEQMLPAIRGATVALLTDMEYSVVRAMRVVDMHDKLMEAYSAKFKQLNNSLPFTDVIISKMLLQ
ncbi:flagellar basal body-associated FliL family protein [Kluyvera sichuanensis]